MPRRPAEQITVRHDNPLVAMAVRFSNSPPIRGDSTTLGTLDKDRFCLTE